MTHMVVSPDLLMRVLENVNQKSGIDPRSSHQTTKRVSIVVFERGKSANIQDEPDCGETGCSGFNCGVDALGILSFGLPIARPEAAIDVVLSDSITSLESSGTGRGTGTALSMSRANSSAFTIRAFDAARSLARSLRSVVRHVVTPVLAMLMITLAESMSIAVLPDAGT